MADDNPIECTLILKRIYEAPLERVWRAWTSESELALWYLAGDDHIIHFAEADVRVGGVYRVAFGPPGADPYVETGRYTEVTPMTRLAFEEVVAKPDDPAVHTGRVLVEFIDLGDGRTQIVLTDQGEHAWQSGAGWLPCLQSLARHLAR